jgi:hypothetical protein
MTTTSAAALKIESLSSNDVISALYSNSATERCRLGLADAVIYEDGKPSRWYVTGSMGEIKLKRTLDMKSLSRRWMSIAQQLETNYICAIRQDNGLVKFLGQDAWESFSEEKLPDITINSVHCFLGTGTKSIIYRSHYVYNPTTNRWIINTQTYTVPTVDPLYVANEEKLTFTDSRATTINKVTDLATTTVVKYMERMLRVSFLECSLDFVIDNKSQIWMLWCPKATFYRTTDQQQTFPRLDERPKSSGGDLLIGKDKSAQLLAQQLRIMEKTSQTQKDANASHLQTLNATHQFNNNQDYSPEDKKKQQSSKFPQPFRCHGDFCHLDISTTGQLSLNPIEANIHVAETLFTPEEVNKLRKDVRFNSMMEFNSSGLANAMINQRSITFARKERRGLAKEEGLGKGQTWKEYPDISSKIIQFPSTDDVLKGSGDTGRQWSATSHSNIEPDSLVCSTLVVFSRFRHSFIVFFVYLVGYCQ